MSFPSVVSAAAEVRLPVERASFAIDAARRVLRFLLCAVVLNSANVFATESPPAQTPSAAVTAPLYFASPEAAVAEANRLLAAHDWQTLARAYDLSGAPHVEAASLIDGRAFLDTSASATGPAAISRWRWPFPPGSALASAEPAGDRSSLPCIWNVTTILTVPQGAGRVQKAVSTCHLIQTQAGFQFLPPAPTESQTRPTPRPVTDDAWNARGAEPVLFFRPELKERAEREIPAARLADLPALVEAVAKLKKLAQAHPGATHPGEKPWEPASVYQPSNDELLLSLAGDRVWRILQLAPLGAAEEVYAKHPEFSVESLEYPHIEIVRVSVAGVGPSLYALPPASRTVGLKRKAP